MRKECDNGSRDAILQVNEYCNINDYENRYLVISNSTV